MGRIETSDLKLITSEPMVGKQKAKPSTRAKWRSSLSACRGVEKKGLTELVLLERRCYNSYRIGLRNCDEDDLAVRDLIRATSQ
jgi:hypothetical protein